MHVKSDLPPLVSGSSAKTNKLNGSKFALTNEKTVPAYKRKVAKSAAVSSISLQKLQ